jgi:tRNA (guanine-N7-)-methyltransferase
VSSLSPSSLPGPGPGGGSARFPAGPASHPHADAHHERRIRTFHPRRSRVTPGQAAALERHWARWGVEIDGRPLDLDALFADAGLDGAGLVGAGQGAARQGDADSGGGAERGGAGRAGGAGLPVVLEIGFGMGEATAAMAAADPGTGVLAADVHTPGQGNLLALAARAGLRNVRVANGDAVVLLRDMIAPGALAGLRVFFPDPWPKARHHKRRLIQPEFVALAVSRLRPGAFVHCATDWEPYAEQMLEVLGGCAELANRYEGWAPRPEERPLTRFEQQGIDKGHVVRDLVFTRR